MKKILVSAEMPLAKRVGVTCAVILLGSLLGACSNSDSAPETASDTANTTTANTGTGTGSTTTGTGLTSTSGGGTGTGTGTDTGGSGTGTGTGTDTGGSGTGTGTGTDTGGSGTGTGTGTGTDTGGSGSGTGTGTDTGGSGTGTGTGTGTDTGGSGSGTGTGTDTGGSGTGTGTGTDTGGSGSGTGTGADTSGTAGVTTGTGSSDGNYTKMDGGGNPLPASSGSWVCVKDNDTGLLWEGKTNDDGMRDTNWEYTWFDGTAGQQGLPPSGTRYPCGGLSQCDSQTYATAVKGLKLCGKTDWRLPTPTELLSIAKRTENPPPVDTAYFPNTNTGPIPYCTSDMMLAVNFSMSFTPDSSLDAASSLLVVNDGRKAQCRVRLVSGSTTP